MSNYSDQRSYGSSREYYNKDYARGTNNTSNNNSAPNTSYNAYAADNNANPGYGIPAVPALATPQLDLTQVASLIAQSPQALNLLLALQQVQQLTPSQQGGVPTSTAQSYASNNAGYNNSSSGYNNAPARTRSNGSEYYGGRGDSSDRSDRRGRDDRSSSSGHGRRDREQYSSRRGGPPEKRDGDWVCNKSDCHNLNFSWRTECHLCHAPRDQSASRDQGGQGSESRDHGEYNQRSSEGHDYINYERPSYRPSDTRHSAADDTRRRGADWHCPDSKCGHFNFSKRDRCQRCSAARPTDHSTDVPRDLGDAGSNGNYPSGGTGYSDRRRERRDRPY